MARDFSRHRPANPQVSRAELAKSLRLIIAHAIGATPSEWYTTDFKVGALSDNIVQEIMIAMERGALGPVRH